MCTTRDPSGVRNDWSEKRRRGRRRPRRVEAKVVSLRRMTRRFSILLAVALGVTIVAPGCKKGSSRLAGRWRGVRAEGVGGEAQDAANAFAGKMQIDVNSDV